VKLTFKPKDPNKGYISNNLLIPKQYLNLKAVQEALSFIIGEEQVVDQTDQQLVMRPKVVELWDETNTHIIVPRAFIAPEVLSDFPFEWVDERPEALRIDVPNSIVPRSMTQVKSLEALRKFGGGTLNLACGKGKTVVSLKYWAERGVPCMVVVNTSALLHQWLGEIREHVSADIPVGIIGDGQNTWEGCAIVIAMVHSLSANADAWPMEFRRRWGLVIFDEVHHMSAPYFVKSAPLFFGDRVGLTATASRTDGLEAIYQYHIGETIYVDLKQDLVPDTIFHRLDWDLTERQLLKSQDRNRKTHHGKLCKMLGQVGWRNRLILKNVEADLNEGRQVLVLTHSVKHSRSLYERFARPGAGLINGEDTTAVERIPILRGTNPVFGTFQLAREALNKPELDTLVVCTPFGNSNDLQQAWGRIQREKANKQTPRVRVYEDKNIEMSREQCLRLRKYLKALVYPEKTEEQRINK
jgi:superfamily II DNA or RNA helicase